jgi:hypothetical protein
MRRPCAYFPLFFVMLAACASSPDVGSEPAAPPDGPAAAAGGPTTTPAEGTPASTGPVTKSGVLLFATGAPIAGVAFESGAQKGTTDAKGAFRYEDGVPVRLVAGNVVLGAPAGADTVSPYQIAGSAKCDDTDTLERLVGYLEALDQNGNPSDGITVTVPAGASPVDLGAADLDAAAGKKVAAPADALRTFLTAFDGEAWTETSKDTFNLLDAALRGQGVATDGTSWFFSGTTGLEKTNAQFSKMTSNAFAIPVNLALQGSDHIGDIDFYNGTIYAPVEDKGYKAPKVVLYDPSSLSSGQVFDVPQALQTAGVPWIAVDGPRSVAYMAEWDPTPVLHVFDLATMAYLRDITLSRTLGRIQGAKVYKGQLYASMDDTQKSIVKIHLASGTVIDLFAIGDPSLEEEGLVFLARPDGTLMHTLDVGSGRTSSELRHHTITREPLRWKVCP